MLRYSRTVQETLITHKIMVPYGVSGKIEKIQSGKYTVIDTIAVIDGKEVQMMQNGQFVKVENTKQKLIPDEPLITGQRVIDTFFPVSKGEQKVCSRTIWIR